MVLGDSFRELNEIRDKRLGALAGSVAGSHAIDAQQDAAKARRDADLQLAAHGGKGTTVRLTPVVPPPGM